MALLDVASPGKLLESWRLEADQVLTQEDGNYRALLIKMVERLLLDHDGERILDAPYLRLFQSGWPQLRRELFLVRYGLAHDWTRLAARELIAPVLRTTGEEEPLLELSTWDEFVSRHIDPAVGESSRKKTRSTMVGWFKKIGSLEPTGGSRSPLRIRTTTPAPLAFGWALYHQLGAPPAAELTMRWAVTQSDAALIFCTSPDYARRCVEAAVQAGLLTRAAFSIGLKRAS